MSSYYVHGEYGCDSCTTLPAIGQSRPGLCCCHLVGSTEPDPSAVGTLGIHTAALVPSQTWSGGGVEGRGGKWRGGKWRGGEGRGGDRRGGEGREGEERVEHRLVSEPSNFSIESVMNCKFVTKSKLAENFLVPDRFLPA